MGNRRSQAARLRDGQEFKRAESQHLERHFLRQQVPWKLICGNRAQRCSISPGGRRPDPLRQRQRQRQGALPGNSHRAKANFPGKLLGFLQALVTEAAAKSTSGVLAAAVGPPQQELSPGRPGRSEKGPRLKFKMHKQPRLGSEPRQGNPHSPVPHPQPC